MADKIHKSKPGQENAIPGEHQINGTRLTANITGTFNFDWTTGVNGYSQFVLTPTGATTLGNVNLPTGTNSKEIKGIIKAGSVVTLPANWVATPDSDAFDNTLDNHFRAWVSSVGEVTFTNKNKATGSGTGTASYSVLYQTTTDAIVNNPVSGAVSVLGSYTIPANTVKTGDVLQIQAKGLRTHTASGSFYMRMMKDTVLVGYVYGGFDQQYIFAERHLIVKGANTEFFRTGSTPATDVSAVALTDQLNTSLAIDWTQPQTFNIGFETSSATSIRLSMFQIILIKG